MLHLKADMEDPDMQEKILARVEQVRSSLSLLNGSAVWLTQPNEFCAAAALPDSGRRLEAELQTDAAGLW